jgi:thioredoxin 1
MIKLIKFFTTSCVPCKRLDPILKELIQEYTNISLEEYCIDSGLPEQYQNLTIMSTPTVLIYKDSTLVEQIVGLHTKDFYKQKINLILEGK